MAARGLMLSTILLLASLATSEAPSPEHGTAMTTTCCPVMELRQYTLKSGRRDVLIELFERELVETQEAVGMTLIGQFRDADRPDRFVWMRGFPDMTSRAASLAAFYGGPTWLAHRDAANATMIDSDNVLLLRPVSQEFAFSTAGGERAPVGASASSSSRILATIYSFDAAVDDGFRRFFDAEVAPLLRDTGAAPVARFETESAANTFPRLPVREGEHVFVWFARFETEAALREHERRLASSPDWTTSVQPELAKRLESPPERLVLEPTPRSRLR